MKIGVIGCGRIAENHLRAYQKIGGIDVAVADLDQQRARDAARLFSVDWHPSAEELLAHNDIVAADICVPTPAHAQMIVSALNRGKHVFCEKPLAASLEEARQIQRAASRSGTILMVGYLYRFHPAFRLVKEVLQQRIIGEPYYGIFRLGGRGAQSVWKHQKEQGGGAINEMLVHMLDLLLWYFGRPKRV